MINRSKSQGGGGGGGEGERNARRADVLEGSKVGVSIQKVGLAQARKQSLCPEEQEEQQLLRWLADVEEVLECNTEMVSTNGLMACEESSQRGWEGDEVRRLVGGGRKGRAWDREGPWKRLEATAAQALQVDKGESRALRTTAENRAGD